MVCVWLAGAATAQAQQLVSAGMSVRFISGTFGTEDKTQLVYVPAVLTVNTKRFEVTGYFPYLAIDDASAVFASSSRMSGVGDVLAVVGYRAVDDVLGGLQVVVSGRIKTPTASYTRGLGTGRADIGVTATVRKMGVDGWAVVEGGFLKVGDPDGVQLRNVALWSAGAGRRIARQVYLLGSIAGNSAILPEYSPPIEAAVGIGMRVGERMTVTVLPSVGFSKSSPSFALTAGFSTDVWSR